MSQQYRHLTEDEAREWHAGHVSYEGAIETEHGVAVPVEPTGQE